MLYLLADDASGRARLDGLRAALGDESAAALNTSTFDGARLELAELRAACEAIPFLSDRRLVVVRGYLTRSREGRTDEGPLLEYLGGLPHSTDVVLLEPEVPATGTALRAVEKLAREGRAEVVRDPPLDPGAAARLVAELARARGGAVDPQAAAALVQAVGTDRRALETEVEKLTLLADGRAVTLADVGALVRRVDETRVFELVDALGARNARAAVRAWRALLREGEDPHRLLAMVGRQVRLLIQAADLARQGRSGGSAASALGVPPGVANALAGQARNWGPTALEAVLGRIVAMDHASKSGGPDLEPALEGLIAELVSSRR